MFHHKNCKILTLSAPHLFHKVTMFIPCSSQTAVAFLELGQKNSATAPFSVGRPSQPADLKAVGTSPDKAYMSLADWLELLADWHGR